MPAHVCVSMCACVRVVCAEMRRRRRCVYVRSRSLCVRAQRARWRSSGVRVAVAVRNGATDFARSFTLPKAMHFTCFSARRGES